MPPPIKTIGLIATARAFLPEQLEPFQTELERRGYRTVVGKTIGPIDGQFAGSAKLRAADLQAMLENPAVDAICCVKGGYGSAQLLDRLAWNRFDRLKPLFGFSDVTALLLRWHKLSATAYHAPMAATWPTMTKAAKEQFFRALRGEALTVETPAHPLNRPGRAEGRLVGGNLSVLYSLLGSDDWPNLRGKILFLEDLDEYRYHLDRMMLALRRAGKLDGLAGLLVGGLTDMHDNAVPFGQSPEEILHSYVADFDYPVAFGLPAGHVEGNFTLRFGEKPARFSVAAGQTTLSMPV